MAQACTDPRNMRLIPLIPALPLTREHGSWAVLGVPLAIGIASSGALTFDMAILAISALAFFVASVPIEMLLHHRSGRQVAEGDLRVARFWGTVALSVGVLCGLYLLLHGYFFLLLFGVFGATGFIARALWSRCAPFTLTGDLVGMSVLSAGAPAAYYVATGNLDASAGQLWLLVVLFFASSVFYVHMKISAVRHKRDRLSFWEKLSIGRLTLLYHIVVIPLFVIMTVGRMSAVGMLIVYVPVVMHVVMGTITLSRNVRFKRLGFMLLGQAVIFGILLTMTIRSLS